MPTVVTGLPTVSIVLGLKSLDSTNPEKTLSMNTEVLNPPVSWGTTVMAMEAQNFFLIAFGVIMVLRAPGPPTVINSAPVVSVVL
jgi:hypothetical protein